MKRSETMVKRTFCCKVSEILNKEKVLGTKSTLLILILIKFAGGDEVGFYDTDVLVDAFRQESYFQYLFGVSEPGFYGLIRVSDGFTTLFAPKLPE